LGSGTEEAVSSFDTAFGGGASFNTAFGGGEEQGDGEGDEDPSLSNRA
jgi:hypothetical protein